MFIVFYYAYLINCTFFGNANLHEIILALQKEVKKMKVKSERRKSRKPKAENKKRIKVSR